MVTSAVYEAGPLALSWLSESLDPFPRKIVFEPIVQERPERLLLEPKRLGLVSRALGPEAHDREGRDDLFRHFAGLLPSDGMRIVMGKAGTDFSCHRLGGSRRLSC